MQSRTGHPLVNDHALTLEVLQTLRRPEHQALRTLVKGELSIGRIETLRRQHPRAVVDAALTVGGLQLKATTKLGASPEDWIWVVPEALEQATSVAVAEHKARRFALLHASGTLSGPVLDLCAGIGGDALPLSRVAPVVAVELSPVRAFCAAANLQDRRPPHPTLVVQGDVGLLPIAADARRMAFHLDPARRSGGKRLHGYADLIPPPPVWEPALRTFAGGAIKLSPGVDFASLPPGHLEVISEQGTPVQAVLWMGALAEHVGSVEARTATVLRRAQPPFSFSDRPRPVEGVSAPRTYLFEIDAAVHRAGLAPALAASLGLEALNADGGYVTGDQRLTHPALAGFTHCVTLGFDEKRLVAALQAHQDGEGPVEVKTRGGLKLDVDILQRRLSKAAPWGATVLLYEKSRHGTAGRQVMASIARRLRVSEPGT